MQNHQLLQLAQSMQVSINKVNDEIRMRNIDWQHLAEYGMKPQAIISYSKKYKCSIMQAKDVVDSFCSS